MLLDAHAHAYEERDIRLIRERTALLDQELPDSDPNKWRLCQEGSLASLLQEEETAGIDGFVLLPVSGSPARISELNRWTADQAAKEKRIIPFGTLLAQSGQIEDDLQEILDLGLKGVKIHPFLQRLDILSSEAAVLWSLLERNNLPIMLDTLYLAGLLQQKPHLQAFVDTAHPYDCGPSQIAALSRRYPGLTLIAAHLGSLYGWEHLGPLFPLEQVYFDLSFIAPLLPEDQVMSVIHRKGADRILFGTDAPWRRPADIRAWFDALPLTYEERGLIGSENLLRLIGP